MFKKSILTILSVAFIALQAIQAQELPAPSPAASVSQKVGVTKVSIDYSSPAVKGRKVFGELEKYGTAWRAGANGPTAITFSSNVTIGGTELEKGTYNIFVTPQEKGDWTFHFNGKGKSIFAYNKDGKQDMDAIKADDAASVNVKREEAPKRERLTYLIESISDEEGKVSLWWDNTLVSFTFTAPTASLSEANINAAIKKAEGAWRTYQNAANFYAATDADKALSLIDQSIAARPDYFWNQWTKAKILAGQEKYDEALTAAVAAKKSGDTNPDGTYNYFKSRVQADIEAWLPNASKKWKKANKSI
ncbi:DUF2911 domain-containing protein [Flammeovirga kamogawensis]|uniref:DUF2911 domain-containing protein n=1 Tax=Flammeovirga kamogawensis TaxID=373891 RepID=A0ABX8GXT2_9BACT|nr:DUF2911 domain-containing protein [Flammeovirga kamogawensis]MBB6460551.1 hypothetical protein [Flammeovirga kamogawensis]QWG07912.1 DUF2911 domain-containing protein [Flammeovirga kamogawensis]TRX69718.1 DUF2911 domain-containing protein [Flammeovirga kamogawensis]